MLKGIERLLNYPLALLANDSEVVGKCGPEEFRLRERWFNSHLIEASIPL
jgi:hypothetical protein